MYDKTAAVALIQSHYMYVSAFLKRDWCNLFWIKIVLDLRCNCTLNFYFNLLRNRTLDLMMDLLGNIVLFPILIDL